MKKKGEGNGFEKQNKTRWTRATRFEPDDAYRLKLSFVSAHCWVQESGSYPGYECDIIPTGIKLLQLDPRNPTKPSQNRTK